MSGRLRLLGEALITAVIALVIYLCLFADRLVPGSGVLGPILREMAATFRDAGTQWMVFLCLGVYFVVLNLLRLRLTERCLWRVNNPDLWLAGALGVSSIAYSCNYSAAAASTQALTLLAGATLGQGVVAWSEWRRDNGSGQRLLPVLVVLLVGGALWRPDAGRNIEYHGRVRWTGPWSNPNIFGLLMSMGMVVAAGQLSKRLRIGHCGLRITEESGKVEDGLGTAENGSRGRSPSQAGFSASKMPFSVPFVPSVVKRFSRIAGVGLQVVFFLAAAGIMSVGLLNSYSRGAWLATACGLGFLFSEAFWFSRISRVSRVSFWFGRNRFALSAVVLSVLVLAFWQLHQVEHTVVRRAMSAGNVNDFSWRNRVAAWEGSLQMMCDRPWFGFSWKQPERIYENYYLPPNVAEAAAIQLNDHLMLGTTLGLPALICFLVYVWLCLLRNADCGLRIRKNGGRDSGSRNTAGNGAKISCRAGAVVLLVGFWFDGGLFNLATAAPFWILLELGQAQPTKDYGVRRQSASGDGALAFDGVGVVEGVVSDSGARSARCQSVVALRLPPQSILSTDKRR